ncbi:hypothetical protein AB1Y20_001564 [Prymnesium parvum]|uniref:UBA domain-containing protein n=1 Tax=Prymnesium parvum TaxID=97485 RepID=A0AB34KDN6_PRYPA
MALPRTVRGEPATAVTIRSDSGTAGADESSRSDSGQLRALALELEEAEAEGKRLRAELRAATLALLLPSAEGDPGPVCAGSQWIGSLQGAPFYLLLALRCGEWIEGVSVRPDVNAVRFEGFAREQARVPTHGGAQAWGGAADRRTHRAWPPQERTLVLELAEVEVLVGAAHEQLYTMHLVLSVAEDGDATLTGRLCTPGERAAWPLTLSFVGVTLPEAPALPEQGQLGEPRAQLSPPAAREVTAEMPTRACDETTAGGSDAREPLQRTSPVDRDKVSVQASAAARLPSSPARLPPSSPPPLLPSNLPASSPPRLLAPLPPLLLPVDTVPSPAPITFLPTASADEQVTVAPAAPAAHSSPPPPHDAPHEWTHTPAACAHTAEEQATNPATSEAAAAGADGENGMGARLEGLREACSSSMGGGGEEAMGRFDEAMTADASTQPLDERGDSSPLEAGGELVLPPQQFSTAALPVSAAADGWFSLVRRRAYAGQAAPPLLGMEGAVEGRADACPPREEDSAARAAREATPTPSGEPLEDPHDAITVVDETLADADALASLEPSQESPRGSRAQGEGAEADRGGRRDAEWERIQVAWRKTRTTWATCSTVPPPSFDGCQQGVSTPPPPLDGASGADLPPRGGDATPTSSTDDARTPPLDQQATQVEPPTVQQRTPPEAREEEVGTPLATAAEAAGDTPLATGVAAGELETPALDEHGLLQMGFEPHAVAWAFEQSRGDAMQALNLLLAQDNAAPPLADADVTQPDQCLTPRATPPIATPAAATATATATATDASHATSAGRSSSASGGSRGGKPASLLRARPAAAQQRVLTHFLVRPKPTPSEHARHQLMLPPSTPSSSGSAGAPIDLSSFRKKREAPPLGGRGGKRAAPPRPRHTPPAESEAALAAQAVMLQTRHVRCPGCTGMFPAALLNDHLDHGCASGSEEAGASVDGEAVQADEGLRAFAAEEHTDVGGGEATSMWEEGHAGRDLEEEEAVSSLPPPSPAFEIHHAEGYTRRRMAGHAVSVAEMPRRHGDSTQSLREVHTASTDSDKSVRSAERASAPFREIWAPETPVEESPCGSQDVGCSQAVVDPVDLVPTPAQAADGPGSASSRSSGLVIPETQLF